MDSYSSEALHMVGERVGHLWPESGRTALGTPPADGRAPRVPTIRIAASLLGIWLLPGWAWAQASAVRTTGLPSGLDWTFNFDAGWGTFGFANSLFENPREDVDDNLSDQWLEGSIKAKLSGRYVSGNSSEIFGSLSAVGERTYASAPDLVGPEVSSFEVEDASIGWRSGTALPIGENAVEFVVGRAPYQLGHGMLLYDGGAEGGTRGGYWTNARKAFELAAIGSFRPGPHTVEVFYLDRNELPEADTGTRVWGANYELAAADRSTLGFSYLGLTAEPLRRPRRDGAHVFNARAYTAPFPAVRDLAFEAEYAAERNEDRLDANAWTAQASYTLSSVRWTPSLAYRYAFFEGDDPDTPVSEGFDPLMPGFHDWGTWWQGEIAGEYFLSNSNLVSNMLRLHVVPSSGVEAGLLLFKFALDEPASFAPGVTAKDIALEADVYVDWSINEHFTASFVAAFANPQAAAEQGFGRTKNFSYGMVFIAYSY
jgi:hypothetical protein